MSSEREIKKKNRDRVSSHLGVTDYNTILDLSSEPKVVSHSGFRLVMRSHASMHVFACTLHLGAKRIYASPDASARMCVKGETQYVNEGKMTVCWCWEFDETQFVR